MRRMFLAAALSCMVGCATEKQIMLLPRGQSTEPGTGVIDAITHQVTVTVEGKTYRGTRQMHTAQTTSLFGATRTTYTNQFSALLLGDDGGQLRCDFTFDSMQIQGTGVCVDYRNVTYDMLIK